MPASIPWCHPHYFQEEEPITNKAVHHHHHSPKKTLKNHNDNVIQKRTIAKKEETDAIQPHDKSNHCHDSHHDNGSHCCDSAPCHCCHLSLPSFDHDHDFDWPDDDIKISNHHHYHPHGWSSINSILCLAGDTLEEEGGILSSSCHNALSSSSSGDFPQFNPDQIKIEDEHIEWNVDLPGVDLKFLKMNAYKNVLTMNGMCKKLSHGHGGGGSSGGGKWDPFGTNLTWIVPQSTSMQSKWIHWC